MTRLTIVAASWAQPRETRMLSSPVTERLFQLANCTAKELDECTAQCSSNDNLCITRCQAYCALKK